MKAKIIILALIISSIMSCNQKPTLEKYFVKNSENKNFVQVDVSSSVLNVNEAKLSIVQKEALKSFDKMNVLVFKLNDKNKSEFEPEKNKVKAILKNQEYQQLMKFDSGQEGASVSFVGTDEHISEFVLFGKSTAGFAIVRILGKDMNPNAIVNFISVLKSSNIDIEQLKPLQNLIK